MRKLIFGSVVILFIVFILIFIISKLFHFNPVQQSNQSLTPTKMPHITTSQNKTNTTSTSQNPQINNKSNSNNTAANKSQSSNPSQNSQSNLMSKSNPSLISQKDRDNITYLSNFIPYDSSDFSIEHSPILDKYIVTTKGETGEKAFIVWAEENGVFETLQNKNVAIVSNKTMQEIHASLPPELQPTKDPDAETKKNHQQISLLMNLFSAFLNIPNSATMSFDYTPPSPAQKPSLQSSVAPSSLPSSQSPTPQQTGGGHVYYPQCGGPYDKYPLTPSKSVCQCGCGPTTVSMILSSYLGRSITPPEVVEIYKSQGRAQCGTSLGSARKIIGEQGVTISDYIIPYDDKGYRVEEVADDMRSYIRNGWTIFVLASFSSSSDLNHFFWITNVDEQNNVFAYDPYYGSGKIPPINQNARYPYPKYLGAFGVRK